MLSNPCAIDAMFFDSAQRSEQEGSRELCVIIVRTRKDTRETLLFSKFFPRSKGEQETRWPRGRNQAMYKDEAAINLLDAVIAALTVQCFMIDAAPSW